MPHKNITHKLQYPESNAKRDFVYSRNLRTEPHATSGFVEHSAKVSDGHREKTRLTLPSGHHQHDIFQMPAHTIDPSSNCCYVWVACKRFVDMCRFVQSTRREKTHHPNGDPKRIDRSSVCQVFCFGFLLSWSLLNVCHDAQHLHCWRQYGERGLWETRPLQPFVRVNPFLCLSATFFNPRRSAPRVAGFRHREDLWSRSLAAQGHVGSSPATEPWRPEDKKSSTRRPSNTTEVRKHFTEPCATTRRPCDTAHRPLQGIGGEPFQQFNGGQTERKGEMSIKNLSMEAGGHDWHGVGLMKKYSNGSKMKNRGRSDYK